MARYQRRISAIGLFILLTAPFPAISNDDLSQDESPRKGYEVTQAMRKAKAILLLLDTTDGNDLWKYLKKSPDNSVRSNLLHGMAVVKIDPKRLIDRYQVENDQSIRSALLLSLGEYKKEQIKETVRNQFVEDLLKDFENEEDAGLHGAVDWLLRKWDRSKQLSVIKQRLRCLKLPTEVVNLHDKSWYIGPSGKTFSIIEANEILIGSPESEPQRNPAMEVQYTSRIDRTFAIATTEVTKAEWREFSSDVLGVVSADRISTIGYLQLRTDDSPMTKVTWYEAVRYCNWLSKREGLPESQWCFVPNEEGNYAEGMKAKDDFLELSGYRLPTEPEWEFSCRAGTKTSRYHGQEIYLLDKYAWTKRNSDNQIQPVGLLKPNDFGLFDMLGNSGEWCYDPVFVADPGETLIDNPVTKRVNNQDLRMARYSSILDERIYTRSAFRSYHTPDLDGFGSPMGIRLVRTIHRRN